MLALMRTLLQDLLRCNGQHDIRAGVMAMTHDIHRMLSCIDISTGETG
jgi:hypothetical protein